MVVGSPGSVVGSLGCLGIGWNFLKCFLFLRVVLPVPSTFTRFWSYSLHSTTLPVRSHRLGWLPVLLHPGRSENSVLKHRAELYVVQLPNHVNSVFHGVIDFVKVPQEPLLYPGQPLLLLLS